MGGLSQKNIHRIKISLQCECGISITFQFDQELKERLHRKNCTLVGKFVSSFNYFHFRITKGKRFHGNHLLIDLREVRLLSDLINQELFQNHPDHFYLSVEEILYHKDTSPGKSRIRQILSYLFYFPINLSGKSYIHHSECGRIDL